MGVVLADSDGKGVCVAQGSNGEVGGYLEYLLRLDTADGEDEDGGCNWVAQMHLGRNLDGVV